jgi:hypothetical protein
MLEGRISRDKRLSSLSCCAIDCQCRPFKKVEKGHQMYNVLSMMYVCSLLSVFSESSIIRRNENCEEDDDD